MSLWTILCDKLIKYQQFEFKEWNEGYLIIIFLTSLDQFIGILLSKECNLYFIFTCFSLTFLLIAYSKSNVYELPQDLFSYLSSS